MIDGQLEALFDWLAVQTYMRLKEVPIGLARFVKNHYKDGGEERSRAMLSTVATMDLGGSSVEIAFAVEKSVADDPKFALPQPTREYDFVRGKADDGEEGEERGTLSEEGVVKSPMRSVQFGARTFDLYAKAFKSGGHNYFRKALIHSWIHTQLTEGNTRDSPGRRSMRYPCSHKGLRYSELYNGTIYVLNGTGAARQHSAPGDRQGTRRDERDSETENRDRDRETVKSVCVIACLVVCKCVCARE